jgi:hypothetical protein
MRSLKGIEWKKFQKGMRAVMEAVLKTERV